MNRASFIFFALPVWHDVPFEIEPLPGVNLSEAQVRQVLLREASIGLVDLNLRSFGSFCPANCFPILSRGLGDPIRKTLGFPLPWPNCPVFLTSRRLAAGIRVLDSCLQPEYPLFTMRRINSEARTGDFNLSIKRKFLFYKSRERMPG